MAILSSIQLKTEVPGPKSRELFAQRQAQVARGPFHVTPIFVKKAKGAMLEDVDGNQLIDFASGIGVTNVGHLEPRIQKLCAIKPKIFFMSRST